jgi:spermidine synthase
MGQVEPIRIDVDAMDRRLQSPEFAPVAKSLGEIGISSAFSLLSTYGGQARELEPWLKDAEINRDDNLRLQFLAGLGMNVDQRAQTYREMLPFRQFPENLFVGSADSLRDLHAAIIMSAP